MEILAVGKLWSEIAVRSQSGTAFPTLSTDLSYFCKFEDSDLCGFIQEKHPDMDSIDWTKNSAKTQGRRTKNTGPVADHSTLSREGAYMYIEASVTKKNDRARLLSPVFFDKSSFQQCLKFWYHMKGRHIGVLRVLVKKRGENETEIWRLSGAQGNTWRTGLVTITHTTPYQLIFEAIMTYDNGYQGDIAIDDILLADGKCSYRPTTTPPYITTMPGNIANLFSYSLNIYFFCIISFAAVESLLFLA
uniref:MAM domain-containing protein n=1 Tax=Ciona savignyi TaxID=51511 RepID=H2YNQ9_CIOSA